MPHISVFGRPPLRVGLSHEAKDPAKSPRLIVFSWAAQRVLEEIWPWSGGPRCRCVTFEDYSTSKYAFNAVWPTLHAHHFSFAVGCLLAAWRPRSGWSHGRAVPVRACCCWWRRYCVRPASPQRLHCASRHEPSPSQRQRRCSRYAQRWPRCTAVLKGSRACYSPGYLQCSRF